MKRFLLLIITLLGLFNTVEAKHLKGGWIQYEYIGVGASPNTSKYRITVRQYLDISSSGGQIDGQIFLGVFDAGTNELYRTLTIDSVRNGSVILDKKSYNLCISPKPRVAYLINKYVTEVDLPDNSAGYILAVQRCCRIAGIVNVVQSNKVGVTYSNKIPGLINGVNYRNNSSPSFVQKDTVLLCYNSPFTFDFSATDADGDSLVYSFCDGLLGGDDGNRSGKGIGASPNPPADPPFISVPYNSPLFDGGYPLGSAVSINPKTGIISGTAPSETGDYVVAVCAQEFRHDTLIGTTKKEIHITVANCALQAAKLNPQYINCNNFIFSFFNESTNSNIAKYEWSFGDPLSTPDSNLSSLATPIHIYKDTGVYPLSLLVTASGGCQDSAKSLVRVFPGFVAKIAIKGSCIQTPYSFADSTYSKYGKLTNWRWNFGESTVSTDTSSLQNPSYLYPNSGQKSIKLWVQNSNGCTDSITQILDVKSVPIILMNPKGSVLVCSKDTIQLSASEQGSTGNEKFKWTSLDSIINPNTPNPFIYPKDTATFYVTMTDSGCVAKDSVIVNTIPNISVSLGSDTSICQMDSIQLHAKSLGKTYSWKSNNTKETIAGISNPKVQPLINPTIYYVQANLGKKCVAWDTLLVNVYPYPIANAGLDDAICYGKSAIIHASVTADKFNWSTTSGLQDSASLNTIAMPDTSTNYVLTTYFTSKNTCPKPRTDTVRISVIPKIEISAGNDTSVVVNQPLNLEAKGSVDTSTASFVWTAINNINTYLNNNKVHNPTAVYGYGVDSITYKVVATMKNKQACFSTDTIKVLIFQTLPELFVPNAFTPNGDGINDIIKPIPVGVLNLDYFSIYNRFGQLLYTTSQIGQGWDGVYNGVKQPSGTYVYVVQGKNYLGKTLTANGTVVLIR